MPLPRPLVCFFALLLLPLALRAGDAETPLRFQARIGGFLGQSYAVTLNGGLLHYTKSGPGRTKVEHATITPSPTQWREFRAALDAIEVWRWRPDYPSPGTHDGTQWGLEIAYPDRTLKSAGGNNYPDARGRPVGRPEPTAAFRAYLAAVRTLLGGRAFE